MKPFDGNGAFQVGDEVDGLRRLAVRGAGVTVFAQGLVFATQLIATVVLARLLTPADYGVVAMVTTFSLLLTSFGENGYVEAVIQRKHIDHFLASNLFWINVGVGLLLALSFAAAGSLLAKFYGNQLVAHVAVGISLTIFISGTSVLHLALLQRALNFTAKSLNDFLSTVISVVGTIGLAWAGWGYWALVAGAVGKSLLQSVGAWYLCRWTPGLPSRANGTASVVRFAMNVYGRYSINYCARNMDNLLVGWRLGPNFIGFYKKAYDLFVMPVNQLLIPVFAVALAALSRLDSKSLEYKRYFLNGVSILAFVGMGIGAYLTLESKDLIRLLLGPQWDASARIFMFFGPGIGVMLIYITTGLIHLSIGRADRWFRWVLVEFAVTGLFFLVGLRWGAEGVAAAWTASFWILIIPAFWYAGKPIGLGFTPVLSVVWKYLLGSLLAGCASAALIREMSSLVHTQGILAAVARIITTSLLFSVLYLGAIILLHGGPAPLYRFAKLLPDMLPSAKSRESLSRFETAPGRPQTAPTDAINVPEGFTQ